MIWIQYSTHFCSHLHQFKTIYSVDSRGPTAMRDTGSILLDEGIEYICVDSNESLVIEVWNMTTGIPPLTKILSSHLSCRWKKMYIPV